MIREIFEVVNEYPWTTFFLAWGLCCILSALGKAIHGPDKTIIINGKEKEEIED